MAIYGSRSPFKKNKSESKESPLKIWGAVISGGLSYLSARKGRKQAARNRRADEARFNEMQAQYNAIDFQNQQS